MKPRSHLSQYFNTLILSILIIGPFSGAQCDSNKIKDFLDKQKDNLSSEFPYRINLFTQGQIDKNKFGTRLSEKASQFPGDHFGQLFYYDLLERGMRVPHWHANATEVGTVLTGAMRVTIWEGVGNKKVFTVNQNNTWVIPQAALHSLENVGKDKLTFILAYNAPVTADIQFEEAWAYLPDEFLVKATGLNENEIRSLKKSDITRLSSFDPGADPINTNILSPLSSDFAKIKPIYQSELGAIKRVDGHSNEKMKVMSIQQTTLKPGTLRVPHWYTAGDTFFYVAKGTAFFTMLDRDSKSYQVMLKSGDLVFLPVGTFHSYLNTEDTDLLVYEVFSVAHNIQEISLLEGAQHLNKGALSGALDLNKETIDHLMKQPSHSYMVSF